MTKFKATFKKGDLVQYRATHPTLRNERCEGHFARVVGGYEPDYYGKGIDKIDIKWIVTNPSSTFREMYEALPDNLVKIGHDDSI